MPKYRPQPIKGLVAGALLGWSAGGINLAAANQDFLDLGVYVVFLFALGGAMIGLALGEKFNLVISPYWPWLLFSFPFAFIITGALVPEHHSSPPLNQEPDFLSGINILLIPALISTTIAFLAATLASLSTPRKEGTAEASSFSLATIFLVMGGASVVFGLLRCVEAPAVFYFMIVIFILGRFASLFFTAVFSRWQLKASRLPKPKEELPEKDYTENTP
jgi:hypothetical protein